MWSLKQWRRRRVLRRSHMDEAAWRTAWRSLPLLHGLDAAEQSRLRDLVILFLDEKAIEPAQGLALSEAMRLSLAMQACLPILNLGLDWYAGWHAMIVYPGAFISEHEEVDEAGVVHMQRRPLSGESWLHGPVIVSCEGATHGATLDGHNVLIHEFVHKLDMLNGVANGQPPLHRDMSLNDWSHAFSAAFDDFRARVDGDDDIGIDVYAAEAPAEFFAVLSEVFFAAPWRLRHYYPAVYHQLRAFFRQDPAARVSAPAPSARP